MYKSSKLLNILFSFQLLTLLVYSISCSDPNTDVTFQDQLCICKPGYINVTNNCQGNHTFIFLLRIVDYQLYKSNIYGFNMTLSSDPPQCQEGTMLVVGWFKLVPNKDLN